MGKIRVVTLESVALDSVDELGVDEDEETEVVLVVEEVLVVVTSGLQFLDMRSTAS